MAASADTVVAADVDIDVDIDVNLGHGRVDREGIVAFVCDGCGQQRDGARVVFTTEATDGSGIDVTVLKRWVTCPSCADEVFSRLEMPSPWDEIDGRTLAYPDDGPLASQAGGYTGRA